MIAALQVFNRFLDIWRRVLQCLSGKTVVEKETCRGKGSSKQMDNDFSDLFRLSPRFSTVWCL
jgi:hypothetical protein